MNKVVLPPLPSVRDWPLVPHELRARDLEVARVVLERAAQTVALHVWHSEECQNAINAILQRKNHLSSEALRGHGSSGLQQQQQAHGIAAPGSAPAAPAVREPLTYEQAYLVLQKYSIRGNYDTLCEIIRVVERAHGIGDSK